VSHMPFVLGNILQPLIDVFETVMRFFHDSVGLGWGFSIIALTVCVRALLVPLTVKQLKSMQAMQRLAPEMKALQAKYKDDKARQQQELMALYKEHSVNPFGSCLPLVAQMPVFFSLYYMLRHDLRVDICGQAAHACGHTKASEFLFVKDITDKATGVTLVILIVLYIGSQLLSSVFMTASVDKNQRLLMMGLPFVFTTFIIKFPAGLIVYWITTNFWTVGQGYLVRRAMPPIKPPADGAAAAVVAEPKAPRRFGRPAAKADDDGDEADDATAVAAPKVPSGPPPAARKKKKRSGRRR
jgi:YidC/Oxa1 family membrane protein insertase